MKVRLAFWFMILPIFMAMSLGSCSSSKRSKTSQTRQEPKEVNPSDALFSFVKDWECVPYRYGGTTRTGVDCSGFVGVLYKEVYNKQIPRTTKELSSTAKTLPKSNLQEGDLVFFDIDGKKNTHVGVYLKDGDFVHASTSKGVIVSSLENPYYQRSFARGGRL